MEPFNKRKIKIPLIIEQNLISTKKFIIKKQKFQFHCPYQKFLLLI